LVSIIIDNDTSLCTYTSDDAQKLFTAINNSRKHLRPWLDWVDKTTKMEHTLHFIQHSLQQANAHEGIALGIFYKQNIIGGVGMHQWDHKLKKAQIGYWISKEYEGQGIMFKSLQRFIDFLFVKTGLNKIEIHFAASNKRSAKLAERLGCKVEGIIRQSVLRHGKIESMVIAGLLKNDWVVSG